MARARHGGTEDDARDHRRGGLTKPSAQKALRRLSSRAEIEADGRKQAIVDPLFAEWIGSLA
jgi:hypothetical protein